MIAQYRFEIDDAPIDILPSHWAYRLYSWMLEQIDSATAEALHEQGEKPISQALYFNHETKKNIWTVNLLSQNMVDCFDSILKDTYQIDLHTASLNLKRLSYSQYETASSIITQARKFNSFERRTMLNLVTPTAFKRAGRYDIFPEIRLILQSVIAKWNTAFPDYPLNDEDAMNALEQGLQITDYALRTTRYPLKSVQIPGYFGRLVISSRLAMPLEEIWQLLLTFMPFCGIGIKTTLGMGAIIIAGNGQ